MGSMFLEVLIKHRDAVETYQYRLNVPLLSYSLLVQGNEKLHAVCHASSLFLSAIRTDKKALHFVYIGSLFVLILFIDLRLNYCGEYHSVCVENELKEHLGKQMLTAYSSWLQDFFCNIVRYD